MADQSQSPILLLRNCEVVFKLRGQPQGEFKSTDLEELTSTARDLLPTCGRLWIDAVMAYDGHAANDEAKSRAGRSSVRLASWEVFPADLVFCPAGRSKLDPVWYAHAAAAQS